ncbi:MAG TPA: cytochrome c [Xanthomonadales bacterium]|nr:cytochrome c [Xanthomonadales bacterium]
MITRVIFVALGLLLAGSVHAAGNAAAGAEKSKPCQACHGADGNGVGNPIYPILAGQYPDYMAQALKSYRSGERVNVIMQGFAGTLSDQDIADLTAYFGSQKSKLTDLAAR